MASSGLNTITPEMFYDSNYILNIMRLYIYFIQKIALMPGMLHSLWSMLDQKEGGLPMEEFSQAGNFIDLLKRWNTRQTVYYQDVQW